MKPVSRLRGMYDISQESWLRKRDLEHTLLNLIGSFGYRLLDMPILEPTELFLRKSGGDLASQIYGFTDSGSNRVSLRPEFTSSIMRHYVEHAGETTLPARWQYCGPVFRYGCDPTPRTGGAGQFTQIGAELIGSDDVLADAELLRLALEVPARIGLKETWVELGDMEVLHSILDVLQLSERARTFIVSSVPQLRAGPSRLPEVLDKARQLHLVGHSSREESLSLAIVGLDDSQARNVLHGFLDWSGADNPGLGQRSPEQVVDRLLRKLRVSDELGRLEQGLSLVMQLVAIRGEPAPALAEARIVVQQAGAGTVALERLAQLLEIADSADNLVLDFGLARGLAYYNGIIFDVKHPQCDASLGGGGRYDGLSRALGSVQSVPALGFAYNLDMLQHALEMGNDTREAPGVGSAGETNGASGLLSWTSAVLVSPDGQASYGVALRMADQLRREGSLVELDVTGKALADSLAYAGSQGMRQVIIVSQNGQIATHDVG